VTSARPCVSRSRNGPVTGQSCCSWGHFFLSAHLFFRSIRGVRLLSFLVASSSWLALYVSGSRKRLFPATRKLTGKFFDFFPFSYGRPALCRVFWSGFFTGLTGRLPLLSTTSCQLSWRLLLVSSVSPLVSCCSFGVFCFVFQCFCYPSVLPCGVFGAAFLMRALLRIKGNLFEVSGEERVVFPVRVSEDSKRRRLSSSSRLMNLDGWREKWCASALQRASLCGQGPLGGVACCCS